MYIYIPYITFNDTFASSEKAFKDTINDWQLARIYGLPVMEVYKNPCMCSGSIGNLI